MQPTKQASTFYTMIALLKVANHYADYLCSAKEVVHELKRDMRFMQKQIANLDNICERSLSEPDRSQWKKEWAEKDYEVFSSVLFLMADMSEEQRSVAEQFMCELKSGNVRVEME